jgi:hypothetical protein
MTMVCPVMKADAGDNRNNTASVMSSIVPIRPSGVLRTAGTEISVVHCAIAAENGLATGKPRDPLKQPIRRARRHFSPGQITGCR